MSAIKTDGLLASEMRIDPIMTAELHEAMEAQRKAEVRLLESERQAITDAMEIVELDAYEAMQMAGIAERIIETMFSEEANGAIWTTRTDRNQVTFAVQEVHRKIESLRGQIDRLLDQSLRDDPRETPSERRR